MNPFKTIDLGELKQAVTPADITAAAKTAGKGGYDFAKLTVGNTQCYIVATPAPRAVAEFILQIGLSANRTMPARPNVPRQNRDSSKPFAPHA